MLVAPVLIQDAQQVDLHTTWRSQAIPQEIIFWEIIIMINHDKSILGDWMHNGLNSY